MEEKYCCGFYYNREDELKQFLGIEEYLNWVHEKHVCVSFDVEEKDKNALLTDKWKLPDTLDMEIYEVRKYQDMTQVEMSRGLGIGVTTLSKIENGNLNISKKVREKIEKYIRSVW